MEEIHFVMQLLKLQCYQKYIVLLKKKKKKDVNLKMVKLNEKKTNNDICFYSAEETLVENKICFITNHNLFKCIL